MPLKIWKYDIPIDNYIELDIPFPAKPIAFQLQHGKPTLWCLVNPEAEASKHMFRFSGTGHPIIEELELLNYIGTVQMFNGDMVWHLFEIVS